MAGQDPMDPHALRQFRGPDRESFRRGLAAALILALAARAPAQGLQELSEDDREAAEELCAPDLVERMLDDSIPHDYVRELLALLEPHLEGGDAQVARTLLCGAVALERFLTQRGEGQEEPLRLRELSLRAHIALGDGEKAWPLAYRLSNELRQRFEFERAAHTLQGALDLLEPGAVGRSWLLLALAEIDRHSLRLEQAKIRLDEASSALGGGAETSDLASAIGGLRAQIQLDLGLVDLAAPWIEAEIEDLRTRRARGEDVSDALPAAYQRLANLRLAAGQYDRTIVDLERALAELVDLSDPLGRIAQVREALELVLNFARIEVAGSRSGNVEAALRRLEEIYGSQLADTGTRLACACRLGQWKLRTQDLAGAQSWLERARALVDDHGGAGAELDLKNRALLSALEMRLSILRGDPRDVQERRLERLGREFEDLIAGWLAQPPRVAGLGFLRYDRTRTVLGELLAGQAALGEEGLGAARALATLQRACSAGSLHRLLNVQPADLAEVQSKLLPPGTGALVYFPFRDRSLLFTVDAEHGVALHVLEGERALIPLARPWKSDVLTSPAGLSTQERDLRRARIASLGGKLSSTLLPPPVVEWVHAYSSILIVGSDLLGELPFEALPLADQGPLGLVKAIGYLPSLPLGVHLHDRAMARAEGLATDLCLVADVRKGPDPGALEPLPFGPDELEDLLAPFQPDRAQTLLRERATLAELGRQDLARTGILTFITHGALDASRERPQGLVLSGGESLWCEDAESWRGGPRLIVLAACGAGRGPLREGDGPAANLGAAFLRGGADCVALAEAQLAYRPTLRLLGTFQRGLAQGLAPGEAMRLARVHVARSEGGEDPFYFALVRLLGLSNRPVLSALRK
jgi:hypothetical protein